MGDQRSWVQYTGHINICLKQGTGYDNVYIESEAKMS